MKDTPLTLLYFAWMRDAVGSGEEQRPLPDGIHTVAGLVDHLRGLSPGHDRALGDPALLRVAVNQEWCRLDSAVAPGDEVAFFPPVTGG
ncbi:molybdopterin converting factor subunit 1 [Yunchengibacter salinarum]|uniref:molybdopterin converting factor subunit 1 n=1 Tax=Yunchengibacter salinarum TaxID=3133399 RepID=UPI0035B589B4